ncbi:MAG: sugar phosphate nucleotidyltransferase [Candidatus Korarchaeota archaeon]
MKGVIIAAGPSTRLTPLTLTRLLPLVELAGKPLIEYVVDSLTHMPVDDLIIITRKGNTEIQNWISTKKLELPVTFDFQEKPGVEGAILAAEPHLRGEEEFVLSYANYVSPIDFASRAMKVKKRTGADAVALVTMGNGVCPVAIDEKARLVDVGTTASGPFYIAGLFILPHDFITYLAKGLSFIEATRTLIREKLFFTSVWERDWKLIQYPWDLFDANRIVLDDLLKGRQIIHSSANIRGNVEIEGPVYIPANVEIHAGAIISGPVYIGLNSTIGNHALLRNYASIGNNSLVGFSSEVKNSIVMYNTRVERHSYVGDSIIGSNIILGGHVVTMNYNPRGIDIAIVEDDKIKTYHRKEKFGAVIGDGVHIKMNVSLEPGTFVWPNLEIPSGSILRGHVKNIPA